MNTDQYDLPTRGVSAGVGTFTEGTVTKLPDGYHVKGSSTQGLRFEAFIEAAYVDYLTEPDIEVEGTLDVTGLEFRLSENELHLRGATLQ